MAEIPLTVERPRVERGSPFNPAAVPSAVLTEPIRSPRSPRSRGMQRFRPTSRSGEAINTRHFTLYVRFASTKKQGLTLAFGARAGTSTARNRAKRQAREIFRLSQHKLPEGIDIVIAAKGRIGTLTRRETRRQLSELFSQAPRLPRSCRIGEASKK